ncbi:MAG: matrixin family metalloprotease [Lentisphaerae bacterium]|nr:matrixin family metalloprotease [Lentisphaerota bacterium]
MRRTALLAAFLALTVLGTPRSTPAFQTFSDGNGHELTWAGHAATYRINDEAAPAGFIAAVLAAMQAWTDVPGADFVFNYDGTTTSHNYGVNDGVNIVDIGNLGSSSVLAQNHFWYNYSGNVLDSDVRFNSTKAWETTGAPGYYDVQNIGTHELGHTLPLADLYSGADTEKTMYGYGATGETKKQTLDPDDVNGICYLYPGAAYLSAPSGVAATDGAYTNKVRLTWNAVSGATGYQVWRGTNNDSLIALEIASDSASPYDDLTVNSNRIYTYWVAATNATLTSMLSAADSGYCLTTNAPLADLAITNLVFLPRAVHVGSVPAVVSLELINRGPYALAFPDSTVALDFYLSNDTTFGDGDDLAFGSVTLDVALGNGGDVLLRLSEEERGRLVIPLAGSGNYYVFARIRHEAPSGMFDVNPTNNVTRWNGLLGVGNRAGHVLTPNDYNGDGISDLAVYEEATGNWFIRRVKSIPILYGESWGGPDLFPFAGDFNNDLKTEMTAYYEPGGLWFARPLTGDVVLWGASWGGPGFTPITGDYDGDGGSDLAVYHEQSGLWFAYSASSGSVPLWGQLWGGPDFLPVPGDYDGDSWYDLAVYSPESSKWYIQASTGSNIVFNLGWGGPGLVPVPGDYNGDGLFDLAVYQSTTGAWFIRTLAGSLIAFGEIVGPNNSVAVSGDYNGDGTYDMAIYNESSGAWTMTTPAGTVIENNGRWGGIGMKAVGASQ